MIVNKIHQGDSLVVLKTLGDNSVDCVVTSPPYWGLRDYGLPSIIWDNHNGCEHEWVGAKHSGNLDYRPGHNTTVGANKNSDIWVRPSREEFANRTVNETCPVCNNNFEGKPGKKFCSIKCLNTLSNEERTKQGGLSNFCTKCNAWSGQLGLEPTFDLYLTHLLQIFDEIKRVLKKTGCLFVNLGDSYSGSNGNGHKQTLENENTFQGKAGYHEKLRYRIKENNLPQKSLCQIPFRFSIGMSDRGWILRNTLIWHKPNCMPSSVKDRFTVDFEYVFFFVKNKKYWFEQQKEPQSLGTFERYKVGEKIPTFNKEGGSSMKTKKITDGWIAILPNGRNKRSVWKIPTAPFKEAHFATFPEALIEPMILSGCPEQGTVLDPFFGSGTTGLVALRHNRNFIGIELNPEYIKIAEKRLEPYLLQEKLF